MSIQGVRINNRKREFVLDTARGSFAYPYARLDPVPTADDPVVAYYIDEELAGDAVTYVLKSGREGFVHEEMAFDYNREPVYMRDMLLYRLTLDAQHRLETSGLSKRAVARRLKTSPAQLYRLLDQTNYEKSIDGMLELMSVLGCDVEFTVTERSA
ncbi:MAG: hypothetical protein WBI63_06815 [Coriobacteriia bacterium]